jgi:hypothetical protein
LQSGIRVVKNGKDKCEIKTAALKLEEVDFTIVYTSKTLQEYIYEVRGMIIHPNISQIIKL